MGKKGKRKAVFAQAEGTLDADHLPSGAASARFKAHTTGQVKIYGDFDDGERYMRSLPH